MFTGESFDEKVDFLRKKFQGFHTPQDKYNFIIELGRSLPSLSAQFHTEEFLVRGCQSKLFLHAQVNKNKIYFTAASDALISAGLAALMTSIYSGESIETILAKPPLFLQELGIHASLSPNRSHGLSQIYLKMKLYAIVFGHANGTSMDRIESNRTC